ncbi:MAG: hypothetical protein ACFB9M_12800 [Myxococcota bacterium]
MMIEAREGLSAGLAWGLAVALLAASVGVFLYIPQWILTGPTGLGREVRSWLATAWVLAAFGAVCGMAWWWTRPDSPRDRRPAPSGSPRSASTESNG